MNKLNKKDDIARQEALNPAESFIVQAPAGSGKTELLTQRFLVLLSSVKYPEEILAITFTKKSADEMRARIIKALNSATNNPEPEASHQKKTWNLAKNVLKQNQKHQWHLLDNPNRLRLVTIDSFNATLTRQLPIISQFGGTPEIIDDATLLYTAAVKEFLSHLEEEVTWADAIAHLLEHMDNDLNKVQDLLVQMLAKRDQWLPYIMLNVQTPELRKTLEKNLENINRDALENLTQIFPQNLKNELIDLLQYSLANQSMESILNLQFPTNQLQDKKIWLVIANLLLTKELEWRKKVDKNLGFPAPSQSKNLNEKKQFEIMKERMHELLSQLKDNNALKTAFTDLHLAPQLKYADDQWQTLQALHDILSIIVAQLKIIFQEHGTIDYIENAQAALFALGNLDNPSDLALSLDYQIKHILIDEFQDTSNSQFRLLEKLTLGWENNDGRTLFVVGDPMQSIYRFREAEVGLFLKAQKFGIGNIKLKSLHLSVNFRSTPKLVDWVNESFIHVFPNREDISTGAVTYSASVAHQSKINLMDDPIFISFDSDKNTLIQSLELIKRIQVLQQDFPTDSIAILVRSRNHLADIIPALKLTKLPFSAIDIDPLSVRSYIQDALSLTRALLHPGDRIAWLAFLRAPWCGLTLNDLIYISGNDSALLIWEQLSKKDILEKLSVDAKVRLNRIMPILNQKIFDRGRMSLRTWVESTWLLIGGPACLNETSDLNDMNVFFDLLDKLDEGGDIYHFDRLEIYIQKLFAAPNSQSNNAIQIMTIHNAKGLEFDHVFIPHLQRKASGDKKQLMLWMERQRYNSQSNLIMAPVHAVGQEKDLIYEYIKSQHAIKNNYELGRLLYVAVTRAKKTLNLFFTLSLSEDNVINEPLKNSLLEKLWPAIKNKVTLPIAKNYFENSLQNKEEKFFLKRLTLNWCNPIKEIHSENSNIHQQMPGFKLSQQTPQLIGTLIHKILQQLSNQGMDWWFQKNENERDKILTIQLLQLGVIQTDLALGINLINRAIHNINEDSRGQWILKNHLEARSEFPITSVIENEILTFIIDRTFIDEDGIRWIIDYKTSSCDNDNLTTFLNNEQNNYRQQLEQYATAIKQFDSKSIKFGLYFPLLPAWVEW